jgi:cytochrome P450
MSLPPGPGRPYVLQTWRYTYSTMQFFEECARRYGDPFTLRLPGFGAFVMVSSPALIKQVMTGDPDQLHAGKANAMLEVMVGRHSVLVLDGKPHLRQRRLLLPPMHGERMQSYVPLMSEIASAAIDRMPVGEPFALHATMQAITLQVILRAVFGLDEGAQMDELAALLVTLMEPPPAFMVFVPPSILKRLDLPGSPYRTFLGRKAKVDETLRAIIRARKAAGVDPARTDVLSLLLAARDEDGREMTEEELRDELLTMLLAGHETTATALSWTFAFVLGDAHVRARLEAEPEGEYADGVVKEALRLRPIIPDVVRHVESPMEFERWHLPAGTYLSPCVHLAHRRAESWPEPDRFKPERFIGAKIDPYAWLPFGGGIRRCLGMAFALMEMKVVVGVMMRRARLRLVGKDPLRVVRRGITLAPDGGTPVVLEARAAC